MGADAQTMAQEPAGAPWARDTPVGGVVETEGQREARVLLWRVRRCLEEFPEVVKHARQVAVCGRPERGETLDEWSSPLRVSPEDDTNQAFIRLVEWVGYFAEDLHLAAPSVTQLVPGVGRGLPLYRDSEGREQGFRSGATPDGARALTQMHTLWLLVHEGQIAGHPQFRAYQEDLVDFAGKLRGAYPVDAPQSARPVYPRVCVVCGEAAVRAEWFTDDVRRVLVHCLVCGHRLDASAAAAVIDELAAEEEARR